MIHNIIVTTPKKAMKDAAEEAAMMHTTGGDFMYFRRLHTKPDVLPGSRIWYVEDGYVRGYGTIDHIRSDHAMMCDTTGKVYAPGWYVFFRGDSWTWVKPTPMTGFRGWRYYDPTGHEVVGDWCAPKPEVT